MDACNKHLMDLALDMQLNIFSRIPTRQRFASLLPVSKSVASLVHASLESCTVSISAEDACMASAARRLQASQHLTSLSFSLEHPMSDDVELSEASPLLTSMDAFWASMHASKAGRRIASLSVPGALMDVPDELMNFVRGLEDLRDISLGLAVPVRDLLCLKKLRSIELLDTTMTLEQFLEVVSMQSLETLRLERPDIELQLLDADVDAVLERSRLKELRLHRATFFRQPYVPSSLKQRTFAALLKAPELRVLHLRSDEPQVLSCRDLPPALEDLDTGFQFPALSAFPATLRSVACLGSDLECLSDCSRLVKLVVVGRLTSASLGQLMRCLDASRRLTHLEFSVPRWYGCLDPEYERGVPGDDVADDAVLEWRVLRSEEGKRRLTALFRAVLGLSSLRVFEPRFDQKNYDAAKLQDMMSDAFLQSPPEYLAFTGPAGASHYPFHWMTERRGVIDFKCATRLHWNSARPQLWRAERVQRLRVGSLSTLLFAVGAFEALRHLHLSAGWENGMGFDMSGSGVRCDGFVESAARFAPVQTLRIDCDAAWALERAEAMSDFGLLCDWIGALGVSHLRLALSERACRGMRSHRPMLALARLMSCKCLLSLRLDVEPGMYASFFHRACGFSECVGVIRCCNCAIIPLNDSNRAHIVAATEVIEIVR